MKVISRGKIVIKGDRNVRGIDYDYVRNKYFTIEPKEVMRDDYTFITNFDKTMLIERKPGTILDLFENSRGFIVTERQIKTCNIDRMTKEDSKD